MRYRRVCGLLVAMMISTVSLMAQAQAPAAGSLTTQDYIDIQQLYSRYNEAIDSADGEAYAATFVPDGIFNTFKGKDALIGFITQWKEKMNGTNRRHWNTNLVITPTAEGANGSVYLMLLDVSVRPPAIASTAKYTDSLVKTPQGWRFKQRTTKGDPPPRPAQ